MWPKLLPRTFFFKPGEEIMTQHHGSSHLFSIRWLDPWYPDSTPKCQLLQCMCHQQPEKIMRISLQEAVSQNQRASWICFFRCPHLILPFPEWCPEGSKAHPLENHWWTLNRDKLTLFLFHLPSQVPSKHIACSLCSCSRLQIPTPPMQTPSLPSLQAVGLYRGRLSEAVYLAWDVFSPQSNSRVSKQRPVGQIPPAANFFVQSTS